jgi:membrane protein implicated in regulation of membrane protease activity
MDAWVIWLIVAVVFAVAEVINLSFYLFPFAIGALGAAVVDLAGGGAALDWITFAVLTGVSFTVVRPIAKRIDNDQGVGQVRLDGEVWSARCYDEDCVIEPGKRVHVMEIRGATALVSE